jgi:hypothetical protein
MNVHRRILQYFYILWLVQGVLFAAPTQSGIAWAIDSKPSEPAVIAQLLKSTIYRRVTEGREIMAHAKLEQLMGKPEKRYAFYTSMLVRAESPLTRRILTDYRLYAQLIPYVDSADYTTSTQTLRITGGIWKFKLISYIHFEEKNDRWIHYRIIGGHFTGLEGDILFERSGEKSTLVYIRGEQNALNWPPAFVIERGAEIVFEFTAKRMRSYIESHKKGELNGDQALQPRSRF